MHTSQSVQRMARLWQFCALLKTLAADFQADGQKTGKYLLGGEEFMLNDRQQSVISYADYAVAMIDEIEKGNHVQQRISVVEA